MTFGGIRQRRRTNKRGGRLLVERSHSSNCCSRRFLFISTRTFELDSPVCAPTLLVVGSPTSSTLNTMPPVDKLLSHRVILPFKTYNDEFVNRRQNKIICYYWEPVCKPRGLLLISHGFTEHTMEYETLAVEMVKRNFFVFAHDHAGHGQSEGTRGHVDDMHDLVEDTILHIKRVVTKFPDLLLFICGHSMGGSISVLTALEKDVQVAGIVMIAPALAPNPETATFLRMMIAKILSKLLPHFPIAYADFSLTCRNEIEIEKMRADPLRYHGYFKARPVMCLIRSGEEILNRGDEVTFPFLLLHGDTDKICHVSGAYKLYEHAASKDKTLKIYPGAFHSLLNEPEDVADDVYRQTIQWLEERA